MKEQLHKAISCQQPTSHRSSPIMIVFTSLYCIAFFKVLTSQEFLCANVRECAMWRVVWWCILLALDQPLLVRAGRHRGEILGGTHRSYQKWHKEEVRDGWGVTDRTPAEPCSVAVCDWWNDLLWAVLCSDWRLGDHRSTNRAVLWIICWAR